MIPVYNIDLVISSVITETEERNVQVFWKRKRVRFFSFFFIIHVRGVFGKYVDKFDRMQVKYTRNMKFGINEYQLLNIKYDRYENLTLINYLDIGH